MSLFIVSIIEIHIRAVSYDGYMGKKLNLQEDPHIYLCVIVAFICGRHLDLIYDYLQLFVLLGGTERTVL